jgi:TP901 family phage tail tape measure protein
MAEDFLPVGIKAVVVGVDDFLSDLRRMQAGIAKFGEFVKDASVDMQAFGGATRLASENSRAYANEARQMAAAAKTVNTSIAGLNKTITSMATRMAHATPRAAGLAINITKAKLAADTARPSITSFFNSIASGADKMLRGTGAYQKQAQAVAELRIKLEQAKGALNALEKEEEENIQDVNRLEQEYKQAQIALDKTINTLATVRTQLQNVRAAQKQYADTTGNASQAAQIYGAAIDRLAGRQAELALSAFRAQEGVHQLAGQMGQARALAGGLAAAVANQQAGLVSLAGALLRARSGLTALNAGILLVTTGIKGLGAAFTVVVGGLSLFRSAVGGVISAVGRMNTLFIAGVNRVKRMNSAMERLASRAFRVGNSIRFLGTSLTFLITFPIVGFLKKMTDAAVDFEEAWAGVVRTVSDPDLGEGFRLIQEGSNDIKDLTAAGENLRAGLRQLALEIPVPAEELARLGEIAGTLGIRGNRNLLTFIETSARLGSTTNIAAEDAAIGLGKLIGVAGGLSDVELAMVGLSEAEIETISNSERFQQSAISLGGVLTALGNETEAFESEILNFGRKIAGVGNVIGLTSSEVLGFSSAFVRAGVDAARGGTAFQKVMTGILRATQEGGEALEIFAATAGTTVTEFVDLFERDASEALRFFIEGMGQAGKVGVQILEELDLADARVAASILSLAATQGKLSDSLNIVNEELQKQGASMGDLNALLVESERRYSTTKNQLQLLKNQFNDLGITIGDFLLPQINKMVIRVRAIVESFSQLSPQVQKFILIMLGLVAVIGPIVTGVGLMLASFGFLFKVIFSAIGVVLSLASTLGLAIFPILALGVAIAGLAIAFAASFKKIDRFASETSETLVTRMFSFGRNIILAFAKGMAAAIIAVVRVLNEIGKVIARWLAPGSPPKLLPDLDKWGAGAMDSYLQGWLLADFSIFNNIADKIESFIRTMADTSDEAGRINMIERIIGSRRDIRRATQEIKKFGKVTQGTMARITSAASGAGAEMRRYILALADVRIATAQLARAQEEVNRIMEAYERALRPVEERLKQIDKRQQQISERSRVIELEAVLADPRAPELVRELAQLEIEEIGLEAEARQIEEVKDQQLILAEAEAEAAEKRLEAAEEEMRIAEAVLDMILKEKELLQELKEAADEIAEKLKKGAKGAEGLGAGDIPGFDPDLLDLEGLIPDDEGLLDDLFADLEVDSLADRISEGFGLLVEDIKKEFEPLLGEGGLFDQLGDTWAPIFERILDFIDKYIPKADGLLGTIDRWNEKSQALAETIAGFIDGVLTELFGLMVDLGLIEPFGPLIEKAEETDGPLSRVGQIIEDIKNFLGDLKEGILGAVDAFTEILFIKTIIDIVGATIEGLKPAIDSIVTAFGNIIEVIGPVAQRFIDAITGSELLRDVIGFLGDALKGVATAIGTGILVVLGILGAAIVGVVNAIARAIEFMSPFIAGLIEGIAIFFQGFIQALDGAWQVISGIIELIIEVFRFAFGADSSGVLAALHKVGNGIKDIAAGIIIQLVGLARAIGNIIAGLVAGVIGLISGFVESVYNFFVDLFDRLVGGSIIVDLKDRAIELFEEMITTIIESILKFVQGVAEKIGEVKGAVETGIQAALDWLRELPGKLFDAGVDAIQGFIDGITSIDIAGKIGEIGGNILGGIKGALGISSPSKEFIEVGQESMEGWIKGLESKLGEIEGLYEKAASNTVKIVEKMHSVQTEVVTSALKKLLDVYENFAEETVNLDEDTYSTKMDIVDQVFPQLIEFVTSALKEMLDVGRKFGDEWSLTPRSLWALLLKEMVDLWEKHNRKMVVVLDKFLNMFKRLLDTIKQAFVSAGPGFRSVGANLVNAMITGLNSRAGALMSRARQIAAEVSATINDAFQIDSPSRVFLAIGENLVDSWASGMESGETGLLKTVGQLADSVAGLQAIQPAAVSSPAFRQAAQPVPSLTTINRDVNIDLGGQTIQNGMDAFELQILIEQAVKRAIG